MSSEIQYKRHLKRSVGIGLGGILLIVIGSLVLYNSLQNKPFTPKADTTYEYTITQDAKSSVQYVKNSFYDNGPERDNTAYVTELTDTIKTALRYSLRGSEPAQLSYRYDITGEVRAMYMMPGDEDTASNVWQKKFILGSEQSAALTTQNISLTPAVTIPVIEYKQLTEQYKTALALPANFEWVVTITVRVEGVTSAGTFNDTKITTISAPLNQQIYKISTKFEKDTTKQIVAKDTRDARNQFERYKLITGSVAVALGLFMIGMGMRKRLFKTPYQRELDRIYRFYDGIVIRASRRPDLTNKNIVAVKSFDDMLNLEEEMKVPIVAVPSGSETTQFMVIRDDVVYIYTLGKTMIDNSKTLDQIQESFDRHIPLKDKKIKK